MPSASYEVVVRDEASLSQLMQSLLKEAMPTMAYNAQGLAHHDAVAGMMTRMFMLMEGAFAQYALIRNERVPINIWPPELLARVVSFLPFGSRETCLRVCHRWHDILVAERSLWDHFVLSFQLSDEPGAHELAAMLHRNPAQPVSLHLDCRYGPSQYQKLAAVVATVTENLRELRVFHHNILQSAWLNVLTAPAPRLEVLLLALATGPSPTLPDNLFASQAPRLHTLDLSHIGLPERVLPALAAVTTLAYTVHVTTCTEIVRASESCPRLERLSVRAERADLSDPPPTFTPPRLKFFTIRGHVAPGYQEALVLANQRDSQLFIFFPLPGARDATLSGVVGLHTLIVGVSAGSTAHVVARGARAYSRGAMGMHVPDALAMLETGRDFYADATALHLPDQFWAALRLPELARLTYLSLLFSPAAAVPYPHMFGAPHERFVCSSLRTLRLATYDDTQHVALSAPIVAGWMPVGVQTLVLSCVALEGELGMPGVRVVREYEWPFDWDLDRDTHTWGWQFPVGDAWLV